QRPQRKVPAPSARRPIEPWVPPRTLNSVLSTQLGARNRAGDDAPAPVLLEPDAHEFEGAGELGTGEVRGADHDGRVAVLDDLQVGYFDRSELGAFARTMRFDHLALGEGGAAMRIDQYGIVGQQFFEHFGVGAELGLAQTFFERGDLLLHVAHGKNITY